MKAPMILIAIAAGSALAQTQVSGDQSGAWTLQGSPYELAGDVTVPPGQSLSIEPGVLVVGQGNYSITVASGATITAVGVAESPITFTATDHSIGWRGMKLDGASDASRISYCLFEYAKAANLPYPQVRGGALAILNCSPEVTHSEFRFNLSHNSNSNGVGGGILTETSNATIAWNWLHDNNADSGAGVCITEYGAPDVHHNRIEANHASYAGGGMYFGARSSPVVHDNVITGNSSSGWGGGGINSWTGYIYYNTYATLYNNVIAGNTTSAAGGGIYCRYDRAVMANNLICFNQASSGGGVFALNQGYSAPWVDNCIVWGNTAGSGAQIGLEGSTGSQIAVAYSDVQRGYPGQGNIDADPRFADAGSGDYHTLAGSPCIDAGNNPSVPFGVDLDLDGKPRFVDDPFTSDTGGGVAPLVDIGPYEYQGCPGDFNGDGAVNTLDVLAFLNAWTAGDSAADFNGDGAVNTLDVLAFLNAWTTGC
ncbi:MAG: hypothetical protein IPJ41_03155 [Phycisphaerales bacterium]|nr:hypothetical protein [Phycisphaerales bacterium]